MTTHSSRTVHLTTDRAVTIPEGDYPEVAQEVIQYVRTQIDKFSDGLHEFVDLRESGAPIMVDHARVLDSIVGYEVRRWLKRNGWAG